jgi:hypothetical protein
MEKSAMHYPDFYHIGFKLLVAYFMFQALGISAAKLSVSQEKVKALQNIDAQLKIMNADQNKLK